MALFKYRAIDPDGTAAEGTMEETSARRVVLALEERGCQVSAVERAEGRRLTLRKKRLTWQDLGLFNEQLLGFVKSGLPLAPGLRSLAQNMRWGRLRTVINEMREDLESGSSLEEAVERRRDRFPPIYVSLIRAGEKSGNLSAVLSDLTFHAGRMAEVRNRIHEALAYPAVVVALALCVLAFLVLKILPVFEEIFKDFGSSLPGPTRLTLAIANAARDRGPAVLAVSLALCALALAAVKLLRRTGHGAFTLDWLRSRVPVSGRTFSDLSLARFSRSLGLLLSGNVPVLESLELAASTAGNAVYESAVRSAARDVAAGERVSDALSRTGVFDHLFCWMLATSEERGQSEEALFSLADSYESMATRRGNMMLTFLGPMVLVCVGFCVLFVIVSVYLPIFTLGDSLSS